MGREMRATPGRTRIMDAATRMDRWVFMEARGGRGLRNGRADSRSRGLRVGVDPHEAATAIIAVHANPRKNAATIALGDGERSARAHWEMAHRIGRADITSMAPPTPMAMGRDPREAGEVITRARTAPRKITAMAARGNGDPVRGDQGSGDPTGEESEPSIKEGTSRILRVVPMGGKARGGVATERKRSKPAGT